MNFMNTQELITKAFNKDFLSASEGQFLFENLSTTELMWIGDQLRKKIIS